MDGAEVRVLEETDQVSLGGLLESGDGAALESEIGLEVLCDFPHQPLERKLPDQKLRALLVLPDLSQSHRPWPESVRLLHSSGSRRRLPRGLRRQLLPRSLSTGGFPSSLLRASHFEEGLDGFVSQENEGES
ncbi:hypothetical protein TIFTF001_001345 [Ficus carica]|uniref:Uncharacterized protein n=1 Tax=Ficus carica TaxID=3494 RepID=A0AA87ZLS4_FICCA|nr:hypothetical protein TIFTF001_001345 [Ficus carica]